MCPSKADNMAWHQCRYAKADCRLAGVDVGKPTGSRMRRTVGVEQDKSLTIAPHDAAAARVLAWLSKVSGKPAHCLLIGVDALRLQGWLALRPRWCDLSQKYSDRQLHDLVGYAFPLTVIQCLITAVTFCCHCPQTV